MMTVARIAQARSVVRFTLVIAGASLLIGCAASQCDPRQSRSFLVAAGCISTGGTDAYIDDMRDQYRQLVEQKQLTDLEQRSLSLQARSAARDAATYGRQIDKAKSDLQSLQNEVQAAKITGERELARQKVILEELHRLQSELDNAKTRDAASEAEILQLREDIAKREAALRDMAAPITVD